MSLTWTKNQALSAGAGLSNQQTVFSLIFIFIWGLARQCLVSFLSCLDVSTGLLRVGALWVQLESHDGSTLIVLQCSVSPVFFVLQLWLHCSVICVNKPVGTIAIIWQFFECCPRSCVWTAFLATWVSLWIFLEDMFRTHPTFLALIRTIPTCKFSCVFCFANLKWAGVTVAEWWARTQQTVLEKLHKCYVAEYCTERWVGFSRYII